MKQKLLLTIALLCAVAQGAWAQNVVNLSMVNSDYVAQYTSHTSARTK